MGINKTVEWTKLGGMDAKKILAEYSIKRRNFTFRLDDKLIAAFKKAIGNAEQSRIIEKLIREFLEALEKK